MPPNIYIISFDGHNFLKFSEIVNNPLSITVVSYYYLEKEYSAEDEVMRKRGLEIAKQRLQETLDGHIHNRGGGPKGGKRK